MNLVDRLLAGSPGSPAVHHEIDGSLTYDALADRVARVRGGLARVGVGAGDRVGIMFGNRVDFVVAYLALLGLGAASVPLNPESPAPELDGHLARSGVSQMLRDHGNLPMGDPVPSRDVAAETPAALVDTAGTSGRPRAAVLTHGNLAAALDAMAAHPRIALAATDVTLGVLPLFHVFGLQVVIGRTLAAGASMRLRDHFDATDPLDGITMLAGVPPMFDAWARAGTGCDDARFILSGGAPLREDIARRFEEATGRQIAQGYGLTETAAVVSSGALLEHPEPMSIGVPVPGVEVRLVDDEGLDVLEGDSGEIVVRGANVFAGYDGDPEATAAVLRDGWLYTGDIGTVDDEGRLYIVDRSKDLIIVSGFNVFPGEVEETLVAHPAVAQAAVVGVDDIHAGESVRAVVVLAAGQSASADELIAWCRSRLARYKCPHVVEFVDQIPTLATGKVLRRQL